jgi:S-methylmethionine-dependent homocysteine/selenocysteine methylase
MNTIAEEYLNAGVDIIVTPTYRGGNYFLRDAEDAMLCHHWSRIITQDIVAKAKSLQKSVRGSIGPIGDSYTAVGSPRSVRLGYEKHLPMVLALKESGVDGLIFETAVKKEEIYALITLAKEQQLPLVISFYVTPDGYIPEPNGKQSVSDMIAMIDQDFG